MTDEEFEQALDESERKHGKALWKLGEGKDAEWVTVVENPERLRVEDYVIRRHALRDLLLGSVQQINHDGSEWECHAILYREDGDNTVKELPGYGSAKQWVEENHYRLPREYRENDR